MNKRIKELIEKSYDIVPHERDWDATSSVFNKEKFAELIVKEVFRLIEDERYTMYDPVVQKVKQRLGIE